MSDLPKLPRFDDIVRSTFCIMVPEGTGTCFVCRFNEHQMLVITCKHMFLDFVDGNVVNFKFTRCGCGNIYSGVLLCPEEVDDDICAIIVEDSTFPCAIQFEAIEIPARASLGDEVFVLGFPFLMQRETFCPELMLIGDVLYPQAILRHGYVASAFVSDKKSHLILLDMHNNPGFSGSLIVRKGRLPGTMDVGYVPIGVIGGYYYDKVDGKIKSDTNSDFAYGCPFGVIWHRIMEYKEQNDKGGESSV